MIVHITGSYSEKYTCNTTVSLCLWFTGTGESSGFHHQPFFCVERWKRWLFVAWTNQGWRKWETAAELVSSVRQHNNLTAFKSQICTGNILFMLISVLWEVLLLIYVAHINDHTYIFMLEIENCNHSMMMTCYHSAQCDLL